MKPFSVEMACLLGIQNGIQAVCTLTEPAYSIQELVYIYSEKQVDLSSTRSLHSYKRDNKTCENEENDNSSPSFIEKLRLKRLARRSQHCEQLESVRNLNPTPTEEKTQPR